MKKQVLYALLLLAVAAGCKKDDESVPALTLPHGTFSPVDLFRHTQYSGNVHYVRSSSVPGQPQDTTVPGTLTINKMNDTTITASLSCSLLSRSETYFLLSTDSQESIFQKPIAAENSRITVHPNADTAEYRRDVQVAVSTQDHYTMKFIR